MPDKLYQECRSLISGCRAIFEDLLEAGIDILPLASPKKTAPVTLSVENQPPPLQQAQLHNLIDIESLADLQQELSGCQDCPLSEQRKQIILGTGNPNARLVLIGAAPDEQEERAGSAFVGEIGQLLDRILLAMKLSRQEVYICNILKCRPPNNREPEAAELAFCEAILKRQLTLIAPEMILSLGSAATQTLLKTDESISKLRGCWQSYAGIPLMSTFHPAYLLQNPAGKHQVWEDVKQVIHRLQD